MTSIVELIRELQRLERNYGNLGFNDETAQAADDFISTLESQLEQIDQG